jgi:hypothetical protein
VTLSRLKGRRLRGIRDIVTCKEESRPFEAQSKLEAPRYEIAPVLMDGKH